MNASEFIKGMNWGYVGHRGEYRTKEAELSLEKLADTGTEWISLCFSQLQATFRSTSICFDYRSTVTELDIRHAARKAHDLGMKICLMPVVDCRDGAWRGQIEFPDEDVHDAEPQRTFWDDWFESYTGFITYYAELAQEIECEMLSVGCELVRTERKSNYWRAVVDKVSDVYSGQLTNNTNRDWEDKMDWWDVLDYASISAFWPVATKSDRSLETMEKNWRQIRSRLEKWQAKIQRPVIFIQVGMRSAATCATMPWDWQHRDLPYDGREQADYYEAVFRTFWDVPWFQGVFWWDWPATLYPREEGEGNVGFCPYGKPAEEIMRRWYQEPHPRL